MADTLQAYEDYINKAQEYVNNYNPNETVNYNDQRLLDVNTEKSQKETDINNRYTDMINNSNKFYQDQINASKEYAQKQSEIQQQNTDFAIEKINQEKEQAQKDYTKEQKGAYTDYQKQTDKYGVNAEQMAASGLRNSGYSESSNVSMYNTYQNRVATAREGFNRAILNYNNSIKEAQLANNSKLAEIAYNALQQQLELSLQGFQYKNTLLQAKENSIEANNTRYDNKYQNILNQINQEIANRQSQYNTYSSAIKDYNNILENIRQFNEQMKQDREQFNERMAYQRERDRIADEQWKKEYALSQQKTNSSINSVLTVDDAPTTETNSSTANANEFINSANTTISNMINIIDNSKVSGNPEKARQLLQRTAELVDRRYEEGLISASQRDSLFNRMGNYIL